MDGHMLSDFDIQIDILIMYQNVGETWNAICKDPMQWLQDWLGGQWSHAEVFAQEFNNRRPEQRKLLPKQWKAREVDGFLYRITPTLKGVELNAMMQDAKELGFVVVRFCGLQLDLAMPCTSRKRKLPQPSCTGKQYQIGDYFEGRECERPGHAFIPESSHWVPGRQQGACRLAHTQNTAAKRCREHSCVTSNV